VPASSAQASFRYMACHRARLDGTRAFAGPAAVGGLSEPGDHDRIVSGLCRAGDLRPQPVAALVRRGRAMLAPDAGKGRDFPGGWRSGVACLGRSLRGGQIVA
jgi:hypothetical protein